MSSTFLLLVFCLLVLAAVIGLVKPRLVGATSRWKALIFYSFCAFICIIAAAITAGQEAVKKSDQLAEATTPTQTQNKASESPSRDVVANGEKRLSPKVSPGLESANPQENFSQITNAISDYGLSFTKGSGLPQICPEDNYCEILVSGVRVVGIGHVVEVNSDIRILPSDYQTVCAVVLSGLTRAHLEVAFGINKQLFDLAAAQNHAALTTLDGVQLKVKKADNSPLLECSYVKFTDKK